MSECLSNDDIKEICQNAFKYEYDVDTVSNLLNEIYKSHDKEIREVDTRERQQQVRKPRRKVARR